ncbi:hypothetical protein SLE2022_309070 [Rubroshorea leprosula]
MLRNAGGERVPSGKKKRREGRPEGYRNPREETLETDSESFWGKWREVCVSGFERDGNSCGVIRRASAVIRLVDEGLVLIAGLDINREKSEAPLLIRVLVAIFEGWNYSVFC